MHHSTDCDGSWQIATGSERPLRDHNASVLQAFVKTESALFHMKYTLLMKNLIPRFSSCAPRSVQPHVLGERSPAEPGWGSPWFQFPRTPSWTCSSRESLTYSNIHSVTRGHRGEETEGTAVQLAASIKSQRKKETDTNIDTNKRANATTIMSYNFITFTDKQHGSNSLQITSLRNK